MRAWCGLLALLALLLTQAAHADQKTLAVVLLPGTNLRDWTNADAPCLHRLMATGALAVMNTRTARLPSDHVRETPESALLTLGAGSRALAPPGARADADWPALVRLNQSLGYDVRLGNLTDALAGKHILVAAGGGPSAALLAASGIGAVPPANLPLQSGVTVWDAGPDPAAADTLLSRFAARVQQAGGRLLVLSPSARDADYREGRRLTPVLLWGPGVPAGLLRSDSTHRAGLVTDTDFAPAVGGFFGLTREDFPSRPFGQAWAAVPASDAPRTAARLEAEAVRQARGMAVLPYLAAALALATALGTALASRGALPPEWPLTVAALLLALLLAPSPLAALAAFVLLTPAAWLGARRFGPEPVLLCLFGAIAAALCADMPTGNHLMHWSLLGYSAVEGARYYGIGNEAMGLLVGTLLVLAARLWSGPALRRGLIVTGLVFICLLLGAPNAGAKAGGVLVSLTAFAALLLLLRGGRWTPKTVLGAALGAGGLLAAAAGADLFVVHGHSHIGEAARRIAAGGPSEAGSLIVRKAAVEAKLAWHSAWAAPLWIGLMCLGLLWRSLGPDRADRALFHAGLIAVGACVLLNDAGVVAGALCVLSLWCGLSLRAVQTKAPPVSRS